VPIVSLISQLSHSLSADHLQLCVPLVVIAGEFGPIAPAGTLPVMANVVASGLSACVSAPGFGGIASSAPAGAPIGLPALVGFAAAPLGAAFFSCAPAPATRTNAPTTAQHCKSFFIAPSHAGHPGARRLSRADAML